MADTQSIIALNIGSQRISMGVFTIAKNNLVLKSYRATSILADPATEAARIPQVQLAIKELAKSLKLGSQKAAYSLSGQSVFIRFVKLPPLEDEGMDELVKFEAQQNVPFPIDEVVWDWAKLDTGGIDTEVILVAIKSESLNDLNAVVSETGLGTRMVDSAPTALYNALRYNYPDLEESTLLIDVGAKTSNLIYAEGNKFFTRSVAIGGAALTSAIAKEFNVSFAEAESSKIASGMVMLGGGHATQVDESTAAMGTVIRNALTRLTAEIQRTNTLFRSQHGGSAPARVMLAGGSANLPYLKEFLEEKLNLPVEFFNPLQRISAGKGVDVDALASEAHTLGELVGLGIRAAEKAQVSIDLVPDAVQAQRDITRRKPALIAASVLFLAGLGAWAGFKQKTIGAANKHLRALEAETTELQADARKITEVLKKEEESVKLINAYAATENGRLSYVNLLNDISSHFASDQVWLTDLEPRAGYSPDGETKSVIDESFATTQHGTSPLNRTATEANCVIIRGLYRKDQQEVYTLLEKLRKSEYLRFTWPQGQGKRQTETDLSANQLMKIDAARDETAGHYAAKFEILVPLKETISLK